MLAVAALMLATGNVILMPPGWSSLCPPKTHSDEILVCGDREPRPSPYRAPLPVLRSFGERGTASVSAERNRLLDQKTGAVGSCSAWGAGGWTGCRYREFKDNVNQAAGAKDPRGRAYRPQN